MGERVRNEHHCIRIGFVCLQLLTHSSPRQPWFMGSENNNSLFELYWHLVVGLFKIVYIDMIGAFATKGDA